MPPMPMRMAFATPSIAAISSVLSPSAWRVSCAMRSRSAITRRVSSMPRCVLEPKMLGPSKEPGDQLPIPEPWRPQLPVSAIKSSIERCIRSPW
jgi:hypothetical protein